MRTFYLNLIYSIHPKPTFTVDFFNIFCVKIISCYMNDCTVDFFNIFCLKTISCYMNDSIVEKVNYVNFHTKAVEKVNYTSSLGNWDGGSISLSLSIILYINQILCWCSNYFEFLATKLWISITNVGLKNNWSCSGRRECQGHEESHYPHRKEHQQHRRRRQRRQYERQK